jgi:hypothetical protein
MHQPDMAAADGPPECLAIPVLGRNGICPSAKSSKRPIRRDATALSPIGPKGAIAATAKPNLINRKLRPNHPRLPGRTLEIEVAEIEIRSPWIAGLVQKSRENLVAGVEAI